MDRGEKDAGLPLDQFSKNVPPGWRPGVAKYPLRRYFQIMGLWWRQTEVMPHCAGPAIAGRLRGTAFQFALSLSAERLDQETVHVGQAYRRRVMTGDELLAQDAHDELTDSAGVVHPRATSGAQVLLRALHTEFGLEDQDMTLVALESFFGHARGSQSLGDYMTMWRLCLEEAQTHSGLVINDVAKSYLLLRSSGLSEKRKDDVLMHVAGDLSRHAEIVRLLHRLARAEGSSTTSSVPSMAGQYWQDSGWDQDSWHDDWWQSSWQDESDGTWAADSWHGDDGWQEGD